ncbi:MAG: hypothetical protein U0270_43125 [Labilithrix sp.]
MSTRQEDDEVCGEGHAGVCALPRGPRTGVVPCCDGLGAWRCERPPDELALTRSHNPASSGRT